VRAYQIAWLGWCGIVGVAGGLAALTWPVSTIALLFVLAALTGAAVAMVVLTPEDNSQLGRDQWRVVLTSTVLAGSGTLALGGIGMLLGAPMAMLVLALTVGGSPYVARRWVGRLTDHGRLPPDATAGEQLPVPVPESTIHELESAVEPVVEAAELSDDALCLAWRASFSALQKAGSVAERVHVVEVRRAYLEELERRNPPGVAAWLASGARAAGNPARFVLGDGATGRSAIDWDDLIQGTDK
jgi:phage shock protein PspC (stress-responsive transcriptional regulator)